MARMGIRQEVAVKWLSRQGRSCVLSPECSARRMRNNGPLVLREIHTDLLARRAQAEAEGWLGELEGIELTLLFLQDKRGHAQRLAGSTRVDLGMPTAGHQ